MDKMEYNGKTVLLNENHNNAAISVKLLDEKEMRRIGFTDFAKDRWYYCKMVNKRCDISFSITIPKENPENWRIDILDEAFCQPYDYQYMLSHGSKNAVALSVSEEVEKQMRYLADSGIISGHERGDYI